jgi:hypothetical protein
MFNNKGKDILVWINCVVFIIVIGLSTFKGTLKEGIFDGGDKKDGGLFEGGDKKGGGLFGGGKASGQTAEPSDKKDGGLFEGGDKKGGGLFGGGKASGQTAEPSDPAIPDSCTTDKQKQQVEKLYKYYKMANETGQGGWMDPYYNWKKIHNFSKYKKEIDEILKKLENKKYKGVKKKNYQDGIIVLLKYDKESQRNAAHMVCDGDDNEFPHPDHVEKKKKKNECEYQGMGVWNKDDQTCACVASTGGDVTPLKGVDKDGNKELTKNGEENKKYNKDNNVKCYCPKKKNGRPYNWDIDNSVCKVKE